MMGHYAAQGKDTSFNVHAFSSLNSRFLSSTTSSHTMPEIKLRIVPSYVVPML